MTKQTIYIELTTRESENIFIEYLKNESAFPNILAELIIKNIQGSPNLQRFVESINYYNDKMKDESNDK